MNTTIKDALKNRNTILKELYDLKVEHQLILEKDNMMEVVPAEDLIKLIQKIWRQSDSGAFGYRKSMDGSDKPEIIPEYSETIQSIVKKMLHDSIYTPRIDLPKDVDSAIAILSTYLHHEKEYKTLQDHLKAIVDSLSVLGPSNEFDELKNKIIEFQETKLNEDFYNTFREKLTVSQNAGNFEILKFNEESDLSEKITPLELIKDNNLIEVKKILENPIWYGKMKTDNKNIKIVPGSHENIISEDLWRKANKKLLIVAFADELVYLTKKFRRLFTEENIKEDIQVNKAIGLTDTDKEMAERIKESFEQYFWNSMGFKSEPPFENTKELKKLFTSRLTDNVPDRVYRLLRYFEYLGEELATYLDEHISEKNLDLLDKYPENQDKILSGLSLSEEVKEAYKLSCEISKLESCVFENIYKSMIEPSEENKEILDDYAKELIKKHITQNSKVAMYCRIGNPEAEEDQELEKD